LNNRLQERYGPWALIAGGSEGIGLCFARRLAAAGIHLHLLARREAPLAAARHSLRSDFDIEVRTHALDLTEPGLEARLDALTGDSEIGLLVYNAGALHDAALFHDEPLDKATTLVALNCTGPLLFSHRLGSAMRERGRGGIILLSSMAGLCGGGYVAVYSATKAFDITLAEGLWAELAPHGVDVLGLVAGATATPAMASAGIVFDEGEAMAADQVALEGLERLPHGPLHVAGEDNREAVAFLRGPGRRQPVALMTAGAAGLFGLAPPALPD
jgi:short-subunit dehydrogenase